jgi:hypothetical protein
MNKSLHGPPQTVSMIRREETHFYPAINQTQIPRSSYSLYQLVYCEAETQFLNISYGKSPLNKVKQTELLPYC